MREQPLFDRSIQTVRAISEITGIHRITLAQACQRGLLGEDAYKSGEPG
jgi:phage FluMu gp28-like protein